MDELKYKKNFVPLFPFSEPNKSVVIAKDQVMIKDSNKGGFIYPQCGNSSRLSSKVRINIHITNLDELDTSRGQNYPAYSRTRVI